MGDDAVQAVENVKSDAILWYDVGVFGKLGYGVPNPSDDLGSLNPNIVDLTNLIGRNLFMMMHHEDIDLSVPPSINTLERIHQLYVRAGRVLTGRAIPHGEQRMETQHVTPAGEIFRVYPVPYFKVRNVYMKRWAGWILSLLSECYQHTENRLTVEITVDFAAMVGQYLGRVYRNMAVEMFGKTREEVAAREFLLTEEDFRTYNPNQWFTPQEMIDTVPAFDNVFTEDRKAHLAAGIPITDLPVLKPWPQNLIATYERLRKSRQSEFNPDTGQVDTTGDRTRPAPVFPAVETFV